MRDTTCDHDSTLAHAVTAGAYAASFGFDWEHAQDALEKVHEEAAELREALAGGNPPQIHEELGDLLFAVCNVARKLGLAPDDALQAATKKFEHRFSLLLAAVRESGREPEHLPLEELERVWVDLKRPR